MHILDRLRWQSRRRLVGKQIILVPMMDRIRNQDERLVNRTCPILRCAVERACVRRGRTPGIPLSIDDRQARVGDAEATVLVDGCYVGGSSDVECILADQRFVGDVVSAGDKRELVCWDAGPSL